METLGSSSTRCWWQEIEDPAGYIEYLGRPHAAAVASQARIAQAAADRAATEPEQEAEARRASQVKAGGAGLVSLSGVGRGLPRVPGGAVAGRRSAPKELPTDRPRRLLLMGLVTNLLNPKIAVLSVPLLPQFTVAG